MKLAKASKQDFKLLWNIFRMMELKKYSYDQTRISRCDKVICGRLEQLGTGGFTRVVMGCETLIDNCCDPEVDHYDFSPRIKQALELLEKSKQEAA